MELMRIMGKKFKKSLVGYNPADVKNEIKKQENEFYTLFNSYSVELDMLTKKNKELKEQLKLLKEQTTNNKIQSEELKKGLYAKYMDACTRIYEVEKKLEEMVAYKSSVLQNKQRKNHEIQSTISKLSNELNAMIKE